MKDHGPTRKGAERACKLFPTNLFNPPGPLNKLLPSRAQVRGETGLRKSVLTDCMARDDERARMAFSNDLHFQALPRRAEQRGIDAERRALYGQLGSNVKPSTRQARFNTEAYRAACEDEYANVDEAQLRSRLKATLACDTMPHRCPEVPSAASSEEERASQGAAEGGEGEEAPAVAATEEVVQGFIEALTELERIVAPGPEGGKDDGEDEEEEHNGIYAHASAPTPSPSPPPAVH